MMSYRNRPRVGAVRPSFCAALLLGLLLSACVRTVPPSTPTEPPPTQTVEQRPTTTEPASTLAADEWDSLDLHKKAMLPAFTGDVDGFPQATRYLIDLTVDVERATFVGTERVRYTNNEDVPLSEVVFRLLGNTPGYAGSTVVREVEVDGVKTQMDLRLGDSALYVPLASPLPPGEQAELSLSFEGTLDTVGESGYAQYGFVDGVLALPNVYPLIPAYDDEGWNVELAPTYGDATFTDTSLYQVRVTLPKDMIVATSGVIVDTKENGDGTRTYTCASGPMRDFNIVASAKYEILSATVGQVLLNCYYLPGDQSGGERGLDYASEALRIFQDLVGDYPFNELDVMATPTLAGGIEYPGLIVVADRLYSQTRGFFEWVVVHEVAHQWWYSLIGNDQLDEPWLDEALTQYTCLLYFEHRYGETAAKEVLASAFLDPYQQLQEGREDLPAGLPVAAYPEGLYGAVVYGKGPLFFHELRLQVGDETFYDILRTYYSRYRYKVAYPRDLISVAEQVSQQDLHTLYAKWILGD